MKGFFLAATSAAVLLASGCASLVDGKHQTVAFASNPDNATIWVNGVQMGKTPASITLDRQGGKQTLKFTKEGYKDAEVPLTSALNPWLLGNVVIGGLLGSTTDGLSGAAYKYSPGNYMVTLQPADGASLPGNISTTDKQKLVDFIVAGYSSLTAELSGKPGQYVTSLMKMANVAEPQQAETAKKLKALSEAYSTIPEFAEKAADLLSRK